MAAAPPPVSRQPECPACHPHEWHLLPCDWCLCEHPPIPGIKETP